MNYVLWGLLSVALPVLALTGAWGVGLRSNRKADNANTLRLAWMERRFPTEHQGMFMPITGRDRNKFSLAMVAWSRTRLPLSRQVALIRAGVTPELSGTPACQALSSSDLDVMAGLHELSL